MLNIRADDFLRHIRHAWFPGDDRDGGMIHSNPPPVDLWSGFEWFQSSTTLNSFSNEFSREIVIERERKRI